MNRISFALASLLSLLSLLLPGCAPSAPPRWAEGGTPLQIAPARWQRSEADTIVLQADGRVLEGGHLRFVIDRVGRVTDNDYEPYAVLLPDGRLVGTDERALGYVGVNNASPPFSAQAWLSVLPDGHVVFFEGGGDRVAIGQWTGCNGPSRRACTLITQLFTEQNLRRPPPYGPTFGVGVGMGIGY